MHIVDSTRRLNTSIVGPRTTYIDSIAKRKEVNAAINTNNDNWTTAELKAAVIAYIDMRQKEANREHYTKKAYYVALANQFGRSEKSYEYRMQNISYIYSLMGRTWVTGLKPAKNVGARVAGELEALINKIEDQKSSPVAEFESAVNTIRQKKRKSQPKGNINPRKTSTEITQFNRDPEVVAWVLNEANGVCENCSSNAPFLKEDGTPFLEVHHLRRLADGGSDTISNAIAVCPNCHRELHYGTNRVSVQKAIYSKIARLTAE
jgi:5-methylcytosine-specific restriction protein A